MRLPIIRDLLGAWDWMGHFFFWSVPEHSWVLKPWRHRGNHHDPPAWLSLPSLGLPTHFLWCSGRGPKIEGWSGVKVVLPARWGGSGMRYSYYRAPAFKELYALLVGVRTSWSWLVWILAFSPYFMFVCHCWLVFSRWQGSLLLMSWLFEGYIPAVPRHFRKFETGSSSHRPLKRLRFTPLSAISFTGAIYSGIRQDSSLAPVMHHDLSLSPVRGDISMGPDASAGIRPVAFLCSLSGASSVSCSLRRLEADCRWWSKRYRFL